MCDPVSLGAASLAMGAIGTGVSVMGQMNAQAAQGAQANYMRQVQLQQQQVAKQQADDALKRGEIATTQQFQKTSQTIGTQTTALAAQGTDLAGSPTDILGDTAKAGALDALTVKNNAAREAWGYEVQASNAGANAALSGSFTPSYLGAGGSLLSGASTLSDKWSKYIQNTGAGSPYGNTYYDPSAGTNNGVMNGP